MSGCVFGSGSEAQDSAEPGLGARAGKARLPGGSLHLADPESTSGGCPHRRQGGGGPAVAGRRSLWGGKAPGCRTKVGRGFWTLEG